MNAHFVTALSVLGPALVVLLLVGAVLRASRDRHRAGAAADPEGPGGTADDPVRAGPDALRQVFPDFRSLLRQVVVPRAAAHPDWERLDGAYGVPGRGVAQFMRGETAYAVNGESRMAALLAVRDWLDEHPGEDPFVVKPSKKGAGLLTLRPEIGWPEPDPVRIETA